MKILELTNFSEGACGVWARAREEATRLSTKGHEIRIFSSNLVKGTDEKNKRRDKISNMPVLRFPALVPGKKPLNFMPGGESFMFWNFFNEAIDFSPDVIISHNYRQFNTTLALMVARKLKKQGKKVKVFLITHAPFPEGDITRTFWGHSAAWFYDSFVGPWTINKFDKILTISHWEVPYLKKIGARDDKIVYIPNGIPEEFFKQKKVKEEHKILFFARISMKKKLETLIEALPLIKDKKIILEVVGPKEQGYAEKIIDLVKKHNLGNRVKFIEPIYGLKEKIKKIDSAKLFILPSRVEGMPQSLIEGMSREKIVIGSDSLAIRDLIKDKVNGYLFEFDNPKDLAKKIDLALSENSSKIKKAAGKSVEKFNWKKVIDKLEKTISS